MEPDVGSWNIGGYNLWIEWKGFLALYSHTPFERPGVDNVIDRSPMAMKTELYYRKIIELCISKNIPPGNCRFTIRCFFWGNANI